MQITDVRVRRIEKEGKMKAIVSIILVLGLLVCLTGCGENEKKQEAIDEFNTVRLRMENTGILPTRLIRKPET